MMERVTPWLGTQTARCRGSPTDLPVTPIAQPQTHHHKTIGYTVPAISVGTETPYLGIVNAGGTAILTAQGKLRGDTLTNKRYKSTLNISVLNTWLYSKVMRQDEYIGLLYHYEAAQHVRAAR